MKLEKNVLIKFQMIINDSIYKKQLIDENIYEKALEYLLRKQV